MAHIPMDDVKELWKQAPHSWSGLAEFARQGQGQKNGIADYLMIELPEVAQQMGNQSFPSSPEQLYDVLNQKLQGMPHHTTTAREDFSSKG